ncbi:competence type IV pilus major pilin ComGC [Jeotgalibacillus sp. ET6]|uniref:competence type IV pilus major pilin ComGC n=1 Tax=Jeotgalibacillus sp. ET6 TaxID=3037260 RepID=UPI002418A1FB|nr:competence type IV pilus major pilin ComGC [Jeotgalibacillus sp. ET6]MDG5470793.1 competence type IV pilus major pilin ComGC [Jeotgalibacillus sp. ET6]
MKKIILNALQNNRGFTLIEMVIVLLVISVLLVVSLPNISSQSSSINRKGCQAFQQMVQAQVESYRLTNNTLPASIEALQGDGYLREDETTCPDGRTLEIKSTGEVTIVEAAQ